MKHIASRRRWEKLLVPIGAFEVLVGLGLAGLGVATAESTWSGAALALVGILGIALPGMLIVVGHRLRYRAHMPILVLLLAAWVRSLLLG